MAPSPSDIPPQASPDITPRVTPRVQLDDLPTEVKVRIIELCAEQDKAFDAMVKALKRVIKLAGTDRFHLADENERLAARHKPTVSTMFQLSARWSALAAPFLFTASQSHELQRAPESDLRISCQTLRSAMCDPVFRDRISRLRARHFRHLVFDDTPPPDQRNLYSWPAGIEEQISVAFLAALPLLPLDSLDTITLNDAYYRHAIMGGRLSSTKHDLLADFLVSLLKRVTTLHLTVKRGSDVQDVVAVARNVNSLHLELAWPGLGELGGILARVPPTLEELHLSPSDLLVEPVIAAGEFAPSTWPMLRVLSYTGSTLATVVPLVTLLAPSLRHLVIKLMGGAPADSGDALFEHGVVFPSLEHLSLETAYVHDLCTYVESIEPSSVPALEQITLTEDDRHCSAIEVTRIVSKLEQLKGAGGRFRAVHIAVGRPATLLDAEWMATWTYRTGVHLEAHPVGVVTRFPDF